MTAPEDRTAPVALNVFATPLAGSTLVEASAGTGKTWAICGLVLRLLLESGLGIQQVLVLSFTKAATAELRERIRERIVQTLQRLRQGAPNAITAATLAARAATAATPATPATAGTAAPADPDPFVDRLLAHLRTLGLGDDLLVTRLDLALQQFDEAAIFTIHGFCQRALGDTPLSTGAPLQQETQADDATLRLQVAQDFWRRHIVAGGLQASLLAHLTERGDSPQAWAAQLKRRRAKPLARLVWPEDLDAPDNFDAAGLQAAFDAASAAWVVCRDEFLGKLDAALPCLHKARYKAPAVELATVQWNRLLAGSDALADPTANQQPLRLSRFTPADLKPNKNQPGLGPHPFPPLAEALLAARNAAHASQARGRLRLLRQWLEESPAALRDAQRQARVQSYDDLLVNLHRRLDPALAGPVAAALAVSLSQRFPAALIDEFQDTDPLQYAIFSRIYPPGASTRPMFFVGDPKQAIYSFRNADLRTYLRARGQAGREATLGENQRSVPALVQACNALFSQHDQPFRRADLPFRPVGVGSKPRTALFGDGAQRPALQLWALPDGSTGPVLPKELALTEAAAATANEIVRLLQASQAGQLRLGERAVRANDIAVLVRSHSQGARMRQALAARGVGSVELSQASLFDSPDAEELATVLAAVLQPQRAGLVRAALATDLLGLDASALAALDYDEAATAGHMQKLADLRDLWVARGIGVMLRQLQRSAALPERLLARSDGERRLTNLLHLAECLQQAAAEHAAPDALLRWLQQQLDDSSARDEDSSQLRLASDRHLVQIITIHRSKGLEYPFVFCPFLWDGAPGGGRARLEGLEGHVEASAESVIDFRGGDNARAWKAAAAEDQRAENLRLVYVALTRAVQRCWLVVGPYVQGRSQSLKQAAASPLHWLLLGEPARPNAAALGAAWQAFAATLAAAHPGAAALQALPPAGAVVWSPPDPGADSLAALPGPPLPLRTWRMGSYSSLMQGARHEAAAVDHDRRLLATAADAMSPPAAASMAIPPDDILRFPRGASAGECLHAVFENIDFTDPATWGPAVDAALARHAAELPGARPEPVLAMLADVLHTPLLPGGQLMLCRVPRTRRLNELEFTLPAPGLQAAALQTLLQRAGLGTGTGGPPLAFGALHGHLRGFVDMVFEHAGRFHVLDWKSNHLGDGPAHYDAPALSAAMSAQGYHLQLLLYTVALHRWLQQRWPGYDYEQHMGAGLYLFVRGVRPGWCGADGRACGVHAWRPPLALVEAASALLGPAAAGPGLAMLDEGLGSTA